MSELVEEVELEEETPRSSLTLVSWSNGKYVLMAHLDMDTDEIEDLTMKMESSRIELVGRTVRASFAKKGVEKVEFEEKTGVLTEDEYKKVVSLLKRIAKARAPSDADLEELWAVLSRAVMRSR